MIREFNDTDWLAFSGATEWDNAGQPLIRESTGRTAWVAVVDPTGVQVTFVGDANDAEDIDTVSWRVPVPTQAMGRWLLGALPGDLTTELLDRWGYL